MPTPLIGRAVCCCIFEAIHFSEMLLLAIPDCVPYTVECLWKCLKGRFSYLISIHFIVTFTSNLLLKIFLWFVSFLKNDRRPQEAF